MRERPLVADLVKDTFVPKMFRVRQKFPRPRIDPADIPDIIRSLLSEEKFASRVKPGMRIAITAGSRGVANVALTTKCIADFVKSRGVCRLPDHLLDGGQEDRRQRRGRRRIY